ncbi:HTH_48 domain-containing protein [Trichonephila clavipes]|nr:HTH_48 domain-containing protein [Trichonephila clavipes]
MTGQGAKRCLARRRNHAEQRLLSLEWNPRWWPNVKQVFLVCSEKSDNEQRCAIKFCFRVGHNATETFAKLQQAYGDSVLSRAQIFRWFKAFSEGRESIEDQPRSFKTTEKVVRVRDLVRSDRRLTVRMIGEELNFFEPHHRSSDFDQ